MPDKFTETVKPPQTINNHIPYSATSMDVTSSSSVY